MTPTTHQINELLVAEDIEGYIAFGAPMDEYSSEAAMIASAVSKLDHEQISEEILVAIIATAWATFELSPEELQLRLPGIRNVAQRIFHIYA